MPSRRAPSATERGVMIEFPFEKRQNGKQEKPQVQEISWNSDTSRKFPGSLGGKTMGRKYRWKMAKKPGLASLQTTFGVVIAGMTLMAATPPRPGQDPVYGRRRGPDEPCKQMAHFRNGQREYRRSSRKPRWVRRRGGETLCGTNPGQEG